MRLGLWRIGLGIELVMTMRGYFDILFYGWEYTSSHQLNAQIHLLRPQQQANSPLLRSHLALPKLYQF
jgi:hypothetical protein